MDLHYANKYLNKSIAWCLYIINIGQSLAMVVLNGSLKLSNQTNTQITKWCRKLLHAYTISKPFQFYGHEKCID